MAVIFPCRHLPAVTPQRCGRRRRETTPSTPNPASNIAVPAGSGTAVTEILC
jgi:hypothetical protein